MSDRIDNWVDTQKRMVGPDAISVATVVLVGPDGDAWGTWDIKTDDLAQQITDLCATQAEALGSGAHHCKLVGLDGRGNQLALLHHRISGKATQALGAGAEANALQRATGVAIANLEQLLATQAGHLEKLSGIADSLLEDRTILVDEFNKLQSDNLDVQLRTQEWLEDRAFKKEVWEFVKVSVAPTLLPAVVAYVEKLNQERVEKKQLEEKKRAQQSATYPPGWPGEKSNAKPTSSSSPAASQSSSRDAEAPPPSRAAPDDAAPAGDVTGYVAPPPMPPPSPATRGDGNSPLRAAPPPLQNQAGTSGPPGVPMSPATHQGESVASPLAPTEAGNVQDRKSTNGARADRAHRAKKTKAASPGSVPANRRPRAPGSRRSTHKG